MSNILQKRVHAKNGHLVQIKGSLTDSSYNSLFFFHKIIDSWGFRLYENIVNLNVQTKISKYISPLSKNDQNKKKNLIRNFCQFFRRYSKTVLHCINKNLNIWDLRKIPFQRQFWLKLVLLRCFRQIIMLSNLLNK